MAIVEKTLDFPEIFLLAMLFPCFLLPQVKVGREEEEDKARENSITHAIIII